MITILYFAGLRERVDCAREQLALPGGASTVESVVEVLRTRGERWREAFAPGSAWRVAVNQRMADLSSPLSAGDEVAFFPPVTGG